MMVRLANARPPSRRRKIAGSDRYREVESQVRTRIHEVVSDCSIAGLADAIQLNDESVRRAMRTGTISLEMVIRICSMFNVSAEWLLFGSGHAREAGRSPRPLPVTESSTPPTREAAAAAGNRPPDSREPTITPDRPQSQTWSDGNPTPGCGRAVGDAPTP